MNVQTGVDLLLAKRPQIVSDFENKIRKLPARLVATIEQENGISFTDLIGFMLNSVIPDESMNSTKDFSPTCKITTFINHYSYKRSYSCNNLEWYRSVLLYGVHYKFCGWDRIASLTLGVGEHAKTFVDTGLRGLSTVRVLESKIERVDKNISDFHKKISYLQKEKDTLNTIMQMFDKK